VLTEFSTSLEKRFNLILIHSTTNPSQTGSQRNGQFYFRSQGGRQVAGIGMVWLRVHIANPSLSFLAILLIDVCASLVLNNDKKE
jgi:hypothetical protein